MSKSLVLVTGGTGYIGSHTVVELIKNGYDVVIIDNLSNSKKEVVDAIEKIVGKRPKFIKLDMLDINGLEEVFKKYSFSNVIHFAGLKSVSESVEKPVEYYRNNLDSTINLLACLKKFKVKNLVFSSSATVYGEPENLPLTETSRVGVGITNPYGWTKYFNEQIIHDFIVANKGFNATILRYFNPIGAHESGLIGENPNGIPNNLLPYVAKVVTEELPELRIFGDDYDTPDGTCIRDYIHVVDLAIGHIAVFKDMNGYKIYNLGTGNGTSVMDVVKSFEKVIKKSIPFKVVGRRFGDVAVNYADPNLARNELHWQATRDIETAIKDYYKYIRLSEK